MFSRCGSIMIELEMTLSFGAMRMMEEVRYYSYNDFSSKKDDRSLLLLLPNVFDSGAKKSS